MSQPGPFYLPPSVADDPLVAERLRAIEDLIAVNSAEFQGKVANGGIIGGEAGSTVHDGMDLINGGLQSRNFSTGVDGWRVDGDGNAEFADGLFRGTVRQTAVSAKATRNVDTNNVILGRYRLSGMSTVYNKGAEMTVASDHIRVHRASIVLAVAYIPLSPDGAAANCAAYIHGNSTLGSGTELLRVALNDQPAGVPVAFNLCSPLLLPADNMYVWAEGMHTVQADWLAGAFLAVHYLSEL